MSKHDPNSYIFIADPHVCASDDYTVDDKRGRFIINEIFNQVIDQATQITPLPQTAIFFGDIATTGYPPAKEDYEKLFKLLSPFRDLGINMHLTIGNVDRRELFKEAFAGHLPQYPENVDGRLVSILETPKANWFMLDTLYDTNNTITLGNVGDSQLHWLAEALDKHNDKPAIIVSHHNIEFDRNKPTNATNEGSGLIDGIDLWNVISPRKHVKAHIFGHTHIWQCSQVDGIHLVNLTTTVYKKIGQPNGWALAHLEPDGIRVELNTVNPMDCRNGENFRLKWRC